jgi:hypothetical protein
VEVKVRAPTRCALELSSSVEGLRFSAMLFDDWDQPVAGAEMVVESSERRQLKSVTDAQGRIQGLFPGAAQGTLRLAYLGDHHHGGCSALRSYDSRKTFPRLTLSGPREIREENPASFVAWTDTLPTRLRAALCWGDRWQELGTGIPDETGHWVFRVGVDRAQGIGPATLRVEVIPDSRLNGTSADQMVHLLRATELGLSADPEVAPDRSVRLRGTLSTRTRPVESALISVRADGVLVVTLRTDWRGRFEGSIPSARLGVGRHTLQASFLPDRPGLGACASRLVQVAVLPPSPLRGFPWLFVLGLGGALLAAVVGMRLSARRRRARMAPLSSSGPPAPPRSMRRILRRLLPSRHLEGGVWDKAAGRPVAGAELRAAATQTTSGSDGRFRLGPLERGSVTLVVVAPGYAPESQTVLFPAREEIWIALWPWREKILRAYGEAVTRLLPGPRFGVRTPSELVAGAHELAPDARQAFMELTNLVQEACYSPRSGGAEQWREAQRLLGLLEGGPKVVSDGTPRAGLSA